MLDSNICLNKNVELLEDLWLKFYQKMKNVISALTLKLKKKVFTILLAEIHLNRKYFFF